MLYQLFEICLELLKWLGYMILGFIGFIIFCLIIMCIPQAKYHYEYLDLDNNNGIAKNCSYKFENLGRGGQGSPVCELEDGTVKQVKEYKYISDGKEVPIKELFEKEK